MKRVINSVYNSPMFMAVSAWISFVLLICQSVYNFMGQNYEFSIIHLIIAICCPALLISYKNRSKNVIKFLIGFILALVLATSIHALSQRITDGTFATKLFGSVFLIFRLALYLIFTIDYILSSAEHYVSARKVYYNKIIVVLLLIMCIIEIIKGSSIQGMSIFYLISALKHITLLMLIVCVESRINAYKLMHKESKNIDNDVE